ncbi:YezD family protein [Aneurinibacillus tyrosinisolvens]|jgi:hypothetical protein|uniref:YezD family protein n=1 Tax=Aneurinibacillus tyrosinisolvens TaxID=1443435 RepID=UPI00063EF70B|nr:YezD family protein [Aneurinibacillus tyrosinisolvens]
MSRHNDHPGVELILQALEEIEYGSLVITIHDSKITQVEKTVKSRFPLESKTFPAEAHSTFSPKK